MTFKQWVAKHKLQDYSGRNPEEAFNRIDYLLEYLESIDSLIEIEKTGFTKIVHAGIIRHDIKDIIQ